MCGYVELPLELGARQTARLELTDALRIAALGDLPRLLLFIFAFFESLREAGFRIDESFSSITHELIIRIGWRSFTH